MAATAQTSAPPMSSSSNLVGWTVNRTVIAAPADLALVIHVCLQKSGDRWTSTPMSCSDMREGGSEALILDFGARSITLDAKAPSKLSKAALGHIGVGPNATTWECFYGAGGTSERSIDSYNVCASDFVVSENMAGTVAGSAVNAVFGVARSVVEVSADRVLAAAAASNAVDVAHQNVDYHIEERLGTLASVEQFDQVAAKYNAFLSPQALERDVPTIRKRVEVRQLAAYRKEFESAKSAAEFRSFAARYAGGFDPENLVSVATSKAAAMESNAQASAADAQKRQELATAREANQKHALAVAFRKSVQVGAQTHCGVVVTVKGPIAEVQAPIGLYWLKVGQLYPAGLAPCDFSNGSYLEPSLAY